MVYIEHDALCALEQTGFTLFLQFMENGCRILDIRNKFFSYRHNFLINLVRIHFFNMI